MTDAITIRHSTPADQPRVIALAELDSRTAPEGQALLAEVGGELRAAVGIADGVAIADPFVPTEDIVRLLSVRAEQERQALEAGHSWWFARFVPVWGEEPREA
jgi:hypothetical protein